MKIKFNDIVKELNTFYAEETKDFNNHVIIYPFNRAVKYGRSTFMFTNLKEFKNSVYRLYYGQYKEEITFEEADEKYPVNKIKGRIQL
jgi:hypothetical protein